MPKILLLSILCVPLALYAQDEEMSDEQMQQVMENADKIQECMGEVDQKAMDALAKKGEKVIIEIKNLCEAGKHDEAQKMADDYGNEMAASKEIQAMQKCGAMPQGMMAQHPGQGNGTTSHVCDGM